MIKISVDQLEAGMKLAKPLTAANGMVLFSEGTELSDTWIERIQQMNVEIAYVEGTSTRTISKEEMLAQLDRRFKLVVDKPYMYLLKMAVIKHIEGLYE